MTKLRENESANKKNATGLESFFYVKPSIQHKNIVSLNITGCGQ